MQRMKDVWRCALVEHGGRYQTIDGQQGILKLCVGNLVTNLKVGLINACIDDNGSYFPYRTRPEESNFSSLLLL